MKRLSGLDASFLYFETPKQLLHVCGLLVLQPDSIPDGYTFTSMKERMERQGIAHDAIVMNVDEGVGPLGLRRPDRAEPDEVVRGQRGEPR